MRVTVNAIHIAPVGDLSLFALVRLPGQWTPVHDHGIWGGIVEGVIEARTLMPAHGAICNGQNMNSFHIYDVPAGTRRLIDVAQPRSR
jgi:predicted metal-dependent enzyme (double-stranded beta helix superfamily)